MAQISFVPENKIIEKQKKIKERFELMEMQRKERYERIKKETLEELFDKYYKDKRFLGTDDISETDLERLKKSKQDYQMRNFDES